MFFRLLEVVFILLRVVQSVIARFLRVVFGFCRLHMSFKMFTCVLVFLGCCRLFRVVFCF